ncbi:S8 family serine peptidase [Actinomadura rifamycini]|uniref:S8 family serine peptidase n=1 Tax=Actinomadura rifamycini TaxID=31962 RepID=UPI000425B862|nr:S8 family serine peptidase [Actinomadura rifamycini]
MRWSAVAVLAGCLLPLYAASPAHAAPRAPANCNPPAGSMSAQALNEGGEPWAQQMLNIEAAHEKATGKGVKVAVVDSGVSARNPQLAGQVVDGVDLTKTGAEDCLGHGTYVAGIIAAKAGVSPFVGVAPDAKIIPIKFAAQANNIDSGLAAKGIDEAVKLGADVVNVSTQSIGDDPRLRQAVQNALAKGVVVVAAAGNIDRQNGKVPALMYPSAYQGVISVGAVGLDGKITEFSNPNTPVSVIAPGNDIVTTSPDGHYSVQKGTSFATPFVAGLAALVLEAYPQATPAEVKQRIEGTAEGSKGAGSGNGMINLFEALTAVNPGAGGAGGTGGPGGPVSIAMPDRPDATTRAVALGVAGGAIGAAALVVAGGLLIPAGRRRGWRPGPVEPVGEGTGESA